MSQANSEHTIAPAPATHLFAGPLSLIGDNGSSRTRGGDCYALQTASERLVVDPRQKGGPGDLVVVWRHGPKSLFVRWSALYLLQDTIF